jgi:8-oxo-dGTP pyrophosphatase MutT (NUDIX family)
MQGKIFSTLIGRLTADEPQIQNARRASVSVILSGRDAPKIMLIKRAEKTGDPWSGQAAFPGGKSQEIDRSARDTAIRETCGEVGIDLNATSKFLGYFRPFRTHIGAIVVIPSVFLLRRRVAVRINEEVSSYRWLNLRELLSAESAATCTVYHNGELKEVPALRFGNYVIWGLTHRIICSLLPAETFSV